MVKSFPVFIDIIVLYRKMGFEYKYCSVGEILIMKQEHCHNYKLKYFFDCWTFWYKYKYSYLYVVKILVLYW